MTPLLGSIGLGEVTEILDGGRRRRPSITHLACHPRIVHAISQHGECALSMAVLDVMTRGAITVTPGDTLKRAMTLMTNHRARHLIVIGNANSSASSASAMS
jgi:CBS domain-containing protein